MAERSSEWVAIYTGLFQMVVVALCFVSRTEQAEASVTWNLDGAVTVRKGEDLSVTCTVSGLSSFDVVRLVHTHGLKTNPISDNGVAKAPFSQLSRYNINYKFTDHLAIITLNYHGIQPEDGGTLGCQELVGNTKDLLNITVLVPVSDIYVVAISSDGSQRRVEDEGRVLLEENKHEGVGCVALVDGSAEVPEIHVAIDDKDETPLFTSTINTTLVLLDSGLTLFKSERKMTFMTSHPNPDFNDKIVKCSVIGSAEQDDAATAVLNVKFAPVIECSDTELEEMVGGEATVTCDIKANPSSRVTWKWTCESEEKLSEQDNIAFNESAISKYHSRVEMTVTQIKDSQFCSYILSAENEIGATNSTVELTKVVGPVGNQSLNPEVISNNRNSNLEALPSKEDSVIHVSKNGVSSQFQFSEFLSLCQWTIVVSTFYLL